MSTPNTLHGQTKTNSNKLVLIELIFTLQRRASLNLCLSQQPPINTSLIIVLFLCNRKYTKYAARFLGAQSVKRKRYFSVHHRGFTATSIRDNNVRQISAK